MNLYNHTEWVKFREEVIRLDDGKCVRCSRSRADGVVLQVHHKSYVTGRRPWEYGHNECETLCKGCHAQEHGIIMPTTDWQLIASDDLGDLNGNCDYCDTELRYVFAIVHPKWGAMAVGTDCCDKLTMTVEASKYHETYVKTREARGRFLSSKRWKEDNGDWKIKEKGISVCLKLTDGQYRIHMDGIEGKQDFGSLVDAKLKAFDAIRSGEAKSFLDKRRQSLMANFQQRISENFKKRIAFPARQLPPR